MTKVDTLENRDNGKRRIGILTTSRADYGILRPVISAIHQHDLLEPYLFVSGTHLLPEYGLTVEEIEADKWAIAERIPTMDDDTTPAGNAAVAAKTLGLMGEILNKRSIDILLVLGDRYEVLAATVAALPYSLPIAHIHGGEVSFGAVDDVCRHAISKFSHLHFATTKTAKERLLQLGEEEWRITLSGAPGIDTIIASPKHSRQELENRFDISLENRPSIVTFHPITREDGLLERHLGEMEAALLKLDHPVIMTGSNSDNGGTLCSEMLVRVANQKSNAYFVESFGSVHYFSVLKHAGCMIGNSSSGIIEAASFDLPVVNIGNRQLGRERASNVIDCEIAVDAILDSVIRARSKEFSDQLKGMRNPYGDGKAGERIADRLAVVELNPVLLAKKFCDIPISN